MLWVKNKYPAKDKKEENTNSSFHFNNKKYRFVFKCLF